MHQILHRINHRPFLIPSSIKVVEEGHQSTYVCTTELVEDGPIMDVFYYTTPKGGQRYLGVYIDNDLFKLCDADSVEELRITAAKDSTGQWQYSRGTNDHFSTPCGTVVSGGRGSKQEQRGKETADFVVVAGRMHSI